MKYRWGYWYTPSVIVTGLKRLASLYTIINYDDVIQKHALSYVTAALRIYWYKLNYKTAFYVSALNRYGMDSNNNKNMDFMDIYNKLNKLTDLKKFNNFISYSTDNPTKVKDNQRLANIMYEAKLRGVKLAPASFASHPHEFALSPDCEDTILMPLQSIKGIGETAAGKISKAYKTHGKAISSMTREELALITIYDEEKQKEIKAFDKKALDALFKD